MNRDFPEPSVNSAKTQVPDAPPPPWSGTHLTEQQGLAVAERTVSIVLSSGAGCGKTHVLTERFLSHLRDDGAEVGQIVAITFTDRAARQMRDRIRRAVLQQLQAAPDDTAAQRWVGHLRALETAEISTIHAFCAALLRQQAIEAGLDPRFDVLDEVMAANGLVEAQSDCLQELLTSSSPAGADLRELILLYGWRPTVEAVQELVRGADETSWNQWLTRPASAVAQQWLDEERAGLLPDYVRYLATACPAIVRCLGLLRQLPCLKPQTQANVRRLLEETSRLAEAPDLAAAVEELTKAARVGRDRSKAWASEEDYEAVKKVLKGYREDLPERLRLFTETPDGVAEAVAAGQRFLRVALEVVRAYRRHKRRVGAVDFQDLLLLTRDLLRDQAELREALQRRYRYVLVDELQDTDAVQMEVVEHLCGGAMTAGKLFAVGDLKQSIYRFRGADVGLFQKLRQSMPHAGRLGLTLNFRSQPALLDFANALFARHLPDYEPLRPHYPQVTPGPCVEFLWSARLEKEAVTAGREREAAAIARRIAAMVNGENLVTVHQGESHFSRAVRPGDVVLLFRSMSNVALYEAALRRQGLDYYLVGGRAFFAQQEIYDVLNLLRALENPQDAVSLAGTLRSPFACLNDETLFLLGRQTGGLWAGLHDDAVAEKLAPDQRAGVVRTRRHLDRWRSLKDRLPIARLLGEILADSGYDAAMQFEFLGERKLANLWKLQELARSFDRSGLFGLAQFIQRLGDLVRNQPREEQAATQPENADVVRLMSIHQAKGLEFPVVIVPDLAVRTGGGPQPAARWDGRMGCVARPPADEEPPPFPDFGVRLWKAREAIEEWHEDLRTLYVACTRAQDYLVLSASLLEAFNPDTAWMLTLAERFDLRRGTCLAVDIPAERIPLVKVSNPDLLAAPPAEGVRPVNVRRAPALGEGEAATGTIPVRLGGKRIVTVAEVERFLSLARGRSVVPADVAWQFDREDGADRHDWARPSERITTTVATPLEEREQLAREVLLAWDFQNVEGWRPLLTDVLRGREVDPEMRRALEEMLALFAASPLRADLGAARTCLRNVEFLLECPTADELFSRSEKIALRGLIDFLWEDTEGKRHLLGIALDPETKASSGRKRHRGLHPLGRLILGSVRATAADRKLAGSRGTI